MIDINGESLIHNSIKKLIKTNRIKEKDIYIVTGFKPDLIKSNVNKSLNQQFLKSSNSIKFETKNYSDDTVTFKKAKKVYV